MKILSVTTKEPNLRAEIVAWTMEDTNLIKLFQPIGSSKEADSSEIQSYHTIIHLIALGWNLVGPPINFSENYAQWWLTKNV